MFREFVDARWTFGKVQPRQCANLLAVSEDRTHDLRIMRPTRDQLRYHRHSTSGPILEQHRLQMAGTMEDAVNRDSV